MTNRCLRCQREIAEGGLCGECVAAINNAAAQREQWARSLRNNPLVHDQNDDDEQRERFASYGEPGDRD